MIPITKIFMMLFFIIQKFIKVIVDLLFFLVVKLNFDVSPIFCNFYLEKHSPQPQKKNSKKLQYFTQFWFFVNFLCFLELKLFFNEKKLLKFYIIRNILAQ